MALTWWGKAWGRLGGSTRRPTLMGWGVMAASPQPYLFLGVTRNRYSRSVFRLYTSKDGMGDTPYWAGRRRPMSTSYECTVLL